MWERCGLGMARTHTPMPSPAELRGQLGSDDDLVAHAHPYRPSQPQELTAATGPFSPAQGSASVTENILLSPVIISG